MSAELVTAPVETPIASDPVDTGQGELARFRQAKAEGVPFVDAPAQPVVEPPATPAPVAAVPAPKVDEADPQTGAPSKRQQYINELIRKETIATMRAQQLEERLAALEAGGDGTRAAQPPAVAPTRPKPMEEQVGTQYATYGDYVEDLADWKVEQREQARTHAEAGSRAQQAQHEALTAYEATVATAKTRHADFDEVVTRPLPAPLTPTMQNAILASAIGADLAYHLATHPEEYTRIRALPVGLALMAMGRLEAQLTAALAPPAAPPPTNTPPPPPMAPVGGSASAATPDPKTMSLKQFRAVKSKFGMTA